MNTVLFGHLDDEIFPVLKDLTENIQHVVDDYKEKAIALFTEELRNRKKIESAVLAKHIECPLRWFLGKTRTSFNENTLKKNFEGLFKDNMKKYVLEPVFRGGIKNTKCKMVTYIHQVSDELQRSFLKDTISLYKEKWPSNLAKYMVRICIPLKYSSKPGSTFCGDLKCSVCPYIESTTTFTGKNKNKVYKISGILNCTTKNVIYLITCKKCEQQYVGQTTRMVKKRFTVHLSGIRSQKESKNESFLANHFKSEGHSEHDIALVVIQQVSNARSLMEREKYWIRELDTLIPEGLNATL
ncbi:uncharacterized protein [Pyxicephalus adspersus]|uniref:uncharacterized protein n=1 Tax=Pyxicephalus adspersus TaxID=30357 RepID=UPI003B5A36AC